MKHFINKRKFCRTSSHRSSMLRNLSLSLLTHERIVTTLPKAKELRPYIEKLITRARSLKKKESFNFRRTFAAMFGESSIIDKLFNILVERYKDRPGGYTRIIKCGFRRGDNAPLALIEFVDFDLSLSLSSSSPEALQIADTSR